MKNHSNKMLRVFEGGILLLLLLFSNISASGETLHPFAKDSSPRVDPNVLMLIDTSGSMTQEPKSSISNWNNRTYGDGTNPYNGHFIYGRDRDPKNNRVTLVDAEDLPNGTAVRFNVNFKYHPNLVYIPRSQVRDMTGGQAYNTAVNTVRGWGVFAEYNLAAEELSHSEFGIKTGEGADFYSPFKYPNDSRMYILKNVMYRLLHDASIYSNLRIGLAAYYQNRGNNVGVLSTHRELYKRYSWSSWTWRDVQIFWTARKGSTYLGAKLHEPFESTTFDDNTNTPHLNNLRKWFDGDSGSDSIGKDTEGNIINRELRADGYTPLAASIYNEDSNTPDSVWQFFDKDNVIQHSCQQNWLILLTDGEDDDDDSNGTKSIKAVEKLVAEPPTGSMKKIKVFVIGFVDQAQQVGLARILNSMAVAGGTKIAHFASDMEELFIVMRKIFLEILNAENVTGGAPLITPPRGPNEESVIYLPAHEERNNLQWKGFLQKLVRKSNLSDYEQEWEASEKLDALPFSSRKIYTSHQDLSGLEGSVNNLSPFNVSANTPLKEILGLADEQQSEGFIQWLRGKDVYNEDENEDTLTIHKLFDINHSGIVKVGPPSGGVLGELYAQFRGDHKNRRPLVFVQTNAGMLHAFDDATGNEQYAFIPPNVLSGGRLTGLRVKSGVYSESEDSYPRYLLNGPLVTEDVLLGTGYKTLLMGLSGPGGPGFYMMDVTYPDSPSMLWAIENSIYDSSGSAANVPVLKEVDDRNVLRWSASLGLTSFQSYQHDDLSGHSYDYSLLRRTISKPVIGRVFLGQDDPSWKWVFLMGSGLAAGVDGDVPPAGLTYVPGALYVGSMEDGSIVKQFSAEAPVTSYIASVYERYNAYGELNMFVAGDASGMVYKGDVSDKQTAQWKWFPVLEFPRTTSKKNEGIFRGINAVLLDRELWLFAGTGESLDYLGKPVEDNTNYFAVANITNLTAADEPLKVAELPKLDAETGSDDGDYSNNQNRKGWYLEFEFKEGTSDREVMTTSPLLFRDQYIFFFTYFPDTSDPCEKNGVSRLYILERKSGKAAPGWIDGKKYKEFNGIKVTGMAMWGDNVAVSATLLKDMPGAGEDVALRNLILKGEIPDFHSNPGTGLAGIWKPEISPSFWRMR